MSLHGDNGQLTKTLKPLSKNWRCKSPPSEGPKENLKPGKIVEFHTTEEIVDETSDNEEDRDRQRRGLFILVGSPGNEQRSENGKKRCNI